MSLFIPTYFAPIAQYKEIVNAKDAITFEMDDNFQKQSYRNRCYIYNSNGKQLLNIPVKNKYKSSQARKKTKDMLVDNDSNWQDHHLKSLQSAYRASPFYEFYEDDLQAIFSKKYSFLQDVTIDTHLFITDALQISNAFYKTETYNSIIENNDFRSLANAKLSPKLVVDEYYQLFNDKHGFIDNLSILDLLFMEGPNTISFLSKKE